MNRLSCLPPWPARPGVFFPLFGKKVILGGRYIRTYIMPTLQFAPPSEIKRIRAGVKDPLARAAILADVFRLNALSMIMEAGSGHPGSTFSAMDIVTWLFSEEMRNPNQPDKDPSDTHFSSTGHDAQGLYAALIGLGRLPYKTISTLSRFEGPLSHTV